MVSVSILVDLGGIEAAEECIRFDLKRLYANDIDCVFDLVVFVVVGT